MNTGQLTEALLRVARERLALHPRLLAEFQAELATKVHFYVDLAALAERLEMQAALARMTGDPAAGADPTPHLVAMVDAWAGPRLAASVQPLVGGQDAGVPVPAVKPSTATRRARVLQAFEAAGLTLPETDYEHLPVGTGAVARSLGMKRQAVARYLKEIIRERMRKA